MLPLKMGRFLSSAVAILCVWCFGAAGDLLTDGGATWGEVEQGTASHHSLALTRLAAAASRPLLEGFKRPTRGRSRHYRALEESSDGLSTAAEATHPLVTVRTAPAPSECNE